ncbi:MAG: stage IV sporulation protein A [Lachnospiraceae bacterium]
MDTYNIYKDINARTEGEIYIGVVGPVRSGKSTFIKHFAERLILPFMEEGAGKERTKDELPQSAAGRTIMTTEPKFIPREACTITPVKDITMKIRLIDCVGFMVEGATGVVEEGHERLVKTPWYDYEIPFSEAAEFGTRKVIKDHSTVGIVMTTDGSIGELPRENYKAAEASTIEELKKIGKPFVVVVNSKAPYSQKAQQCVEEIKKTYDTDAISIDCEQLTMEDVNKVLEILLNNFPVNGIEFYFDKWIDTLPEDNEIKQAMIECARGILDKITYMKDFTKDVLKQQCKYIEEIKSEPVDMADGIIRLNFKTDENLYFDMLSSLAGQTIKNEYELINLIKNYAKEKDSLSRYTAAIDTVKQKGYGVVSPSRDEISISEPEVIKNSGRYGVKIKAESPSYHMIKVNIGTEIAPIVGSEEQANDLKKYIDENTKNGDAWYINIFGKTIEQLVDDGIRTKLAMMNDDCQTKLMDTMQKVVNDNSGGIICLII